MHNTMLLLTLLFALFNSMLMAPVWGTPKTFAETAVAPINIDKQNASTSPERKHPSRLSNTPALKAIQGLTFFTDQAMFEAAFSNLPLEDFEDGNVAPNSFANCPTPLDVSSNNDCFSSGDILPGIQFTAAPTSGTTQGLDLLGAGTAGNPSKAIVAPGSEFNTFKILFDPPVHAAGMDLHCATNPGVISPPEAVTIELFDAADVLIDTSSPDASGEGIFWGVFSAIPIGRINIASDSSAEGVDNVQFGGLSDTTFTAAEIPTLDSWGLLALVLLYCSILLARRYQSHKP